LNWAGLGERDAGVVGCLVKPGPELVSESDHVFQELFDGAARLASRVDEAEADVALKAFAEMVSWMMLRPEPFKEIS
jgi:hypothetical protein